MRLLVTGCAGFIGAKVCELALADGHDVLGVDNLNDAYDPTLKRWRLERLNGSAGFTHQPLDISDRKAIAALGKQGSFDAVVNLAARAGVRQSFNDPWLYYETNLTGALNLLELCRTQGIGKFVQASTSSVYGNGPRPFREDGGSDRPVSPYAASKKAAENLCHVYHDMAGLDVSVLRYFTVYGPAGRPDMSVFRFITWTAERRPVVVFGDGKQERDYTYVDDIARGTLAALAPVGYEVINLGGDHPVRINEVVSTIERLVGQPARVEHRDADPADVSATWADISKARSVLGWEPRVPLEEGLQMSVDWYRENRELACSLAGV